MAPICVRCHVHPNTSITFVRSIKIDIRKIFNKFKLFLLCMATKSRFYCHRIATKIEFGHHNFQLPQFMIEKFLGAPSIFFNHLIKSGH
jgi:hypothetical protein